MRPPNAEPMDSGLREEMLARSTRSGKRAKPPRVAVGGLATWQKPDGSIYLVTRSANGKTYGVLMQEVG